MKHPALRVRSQIAAVGRVFYVCRGLLLVPAFGVGAARAQFIRGFQLWSDRPGCPCSDSKKRVRCRFHRFIGHQITRTGGAELSYATLGKFHYKYDNGSGFTQDAAIR